MRKNLVLERQKCGLKYSCDLGNMVWYVFGEATRNHMVSYFSLSPGKLEND